MDRDRFNRMTAFDYALTHDDGQRPHELNRADIVLAGVSRSSKSSTSFYLAFQGIRAANVPILPDRELPPQLLKLHRNRVIGLRINVVRLLRLREARMLGLGMSNEKDYINPRSVADEVNHANRRRRGSAIAGRVADQAVDQQGDYQGGGHQACRRT